MGEGTTKKLKSAADITENTKIRKPKSTFEGKVRQAAGEKCKEKHKQSEMRVGGKQVKEGERSAHINCRRRCQTTNEEYEIAIDSLNSWKVVGLLGLDFVRTHSTHV
jgi:hypothetical protein